MLDSTVLDWIIVLALVLLFLGVIAIYQVHKTLESVNETLSQLNETMSKLVNSQENENFTSS